MVHKLGNCGVAQNHGRRIQRIGALAVQATVLLDREKCDRQTDTYGTFGRYLDTFERGWPKLVVACLSLPETAIGVGGCTEQVVIGVLVDG